MAAVENVRSEDKVLSYTSPGDESSLIRINNGSNGSLKSVSEKSRDSLYRTILKGNGSEGIGSPSTVILRKKHHIRSVNATQVNIKSVKKVKKIYHFMLDEVPEFLVESRTKTVWSRAGEFIHTKNRLSDFRGRERVIQIVKISELIRVERAKLETPNGIRG